MKQIAILLLIVLGVQLPQASLFAQTGATYTDAYTGMEFVEVQPGSFTMGCTPKQGTDCADSEKPAHQVTLTLDYYIGKHEVTQAQWKKVMGKNPSYSACDNCPVENISLPDIKAFLKKLNAELKKAKPNTKLLYRLPTEAEWEYAARGGHKKATTATQYPGSNTLADVAWYKGNATGKTHPVGGKAANELGLYDMSGNVWEWCSDFYGAYTATAATNPKGPGTGESHVLRGGGWNGDAAGSRLTFRLDVKKAHIDVGFRLVLDVPDKRPPVISSAATASVEENTTGVVYTAVATDNASAASEITFSLASGVKDNDLFTLSGNAVSFKAAPDYEAPADANKDNVYELELTATDAAGNAGTKVVLVTVTDVDDTAPVITSLAAATVAENTTGVVYTAVATDDVSTASDITFSLASGVKDNDLFTLTGSAVSFKSAPDYEAPKGIRKNRPTAAEKNVYELELTATDAAGNAGTKVVLITVTDVNELTYTDAHTSMPFVLVEKGTFTMGCTSEQGTDCHSWEKPSHSVTLTKDYYMGKYEVTQAQWVRVMGSNPSLFTSPACDNCPVERVSWNDIQNFITKLNAELVKNSPAEQRRYRLPTEAEWEYAARGGHKATATKYAGSNTIGDVAWYWNNSAVSGTRKTHPVGGKSANELGLYDMTGNVWEWCSDWWKRDYTSASVTDPAGPSSGTYRVLRGGGWSFNARICRVSFRYRITPASRHSTGGFRLCLSLSEGMP